jgi:UDP-N-acetylmuramate dehydrogenase
MTHISEAEDILRAACGDRVRSAFALAPLTTFRIGGPAALYLEPEDDRDLEAVALAVDATGIQVLVVGKGSNLLVSDAGYEGLVLRLGRGYRYAARDGLTLAAGGATPLPALAGVALRHGLAGLEFGVAIPASVGGAIRMNAGAHGRQMADVVDQIEVFLLSEGGRRRIRGGDAGFSYRRSGLPTDGVVVGVEVVLSQGELPEIRARMEEARSWRRRTQPLAEPNCGSVFKNPEGDHAARLIEAAGLKGLAVGGVHVSEKHANFIVATPGARAQDVLTLIRLIQGRVADAAGITLEAEVHLVGAFDA